MTLCYVQADLHHLQRLTWLVKRTKKRTTEQCFQPKNNAAAGYQGPVKIELLKGAGLLLRILKTIPSFSTDI